MATRAYLLINVDAGCEDQVEIGLTGLEEVTVCDQVTGEMDLIAVIDAPDYQHVLGPLLSKVRQIEGIAHTQTCLVL